MIPVGSRIAWPNSIGGDNGDMSNRRSVQFKNTPDPNASWAKELVAVVGNREARRVLNEYRRLAQDRKLSKFDREEAKKRAFSLAKLL